MRRTVPPSAEIEDQIDQLLAVGVGENPREALSELAKLGARLIIRGLWRTSSRRGWVGLAMSAGLSISAGCVTTSRGCGMAIALAGCRPVKGSLRLRSRRLVRLLSRSCLRCFRTRRSCFAPGRWRRWLWAPSSAASRCETSNRCARRRGSASSRSQPRQGSARSYASVSRRSSAATSTGSGWWRYSSTRSSSTSGPRARRRASFAPGASPRRASGSSSACASGCASRTRTGFPSQGI